jgi:hypothetical protein
MSELNFGWSGCVACNALFLSAGDPIAGVCPNGGPHTAGDSKFVLDGDDLEGADGYRWCRACMGLFWSDDEHGGGVCPANGGGHDRSDAQVITLDDNETEKGQPGWKWCPRCQGVFYTGDGGGLCPAPGGDAHDASSDEAITLRLE